VIRISYAVNRLPDTTLQVRYFSSTYYTLFILNCTYLGQLDSLVQCILHSCKVFILKQGTHNTNIIKKETGRIL